MTVSGCPASGREIAAEPVDVPSATEARPASPSRVDPQPSGTVCPEIVEADRQQARAARVEFGIVQPRQPADEHDDVAGPGVGPDGAGRAARDSSGSTAAPIGSRLWAARSRQVAASTAVNTSRSTRA
ncbi:hypothetical protein [Nocardia rhamnosiphila]